MKSHLFRSCVYVFTGLSISVLLLLIFFLWKESLPFFSENSMGSFLFGKTWSAQTPAEYGIFNILLASIWLAGLACIVIFPIAMGVSIFVSFYITGFWKSLMTNIINILAGIPSIIYGFFGLYVIVKWFENHLNVSAGESVLAGAILLSIMILPYFVSNLVESMELSKKKYQRDSDAFGISKEYFIRKIVLPQSVLSIFTGFILAFSRAVGETMAVMMVIGNTPIFPRLFSKAQTIASLIALEIGMSEVGSIHYSALFAAGFILLLVILFLNIILYALNIRKRERYDQKM